MIDSPQITQSAEQLAAVIHVVVPRHEIQHVMGPGLHELMEGIAAQGIAATGPWFAHHLRMPGETFDFEIGVPVGTPVKPAGRIKPGKLPAATVARTVYSGPYEGLPGAWGEFSAWIESQGRAPATDLWERYVVCPGSSPDPANWRTELNRPLME
jgi:effector-binding domain-containing protein